MRRYSNATKWQGILAVFALSLAAAAHAQDEPAPPQWQSVDASTGQMTGITDLQALKFMFPDSASVRRRLLNAYLEAEREGDALAEAVELVERGYVFSAAAQELLLTLDPSVEQRTILALQAMGSVPHQTSRAFATVPPEVKLVESVWAHPSNGDVFVTSVVSRGLHVRRGGSEEWRPIAPEGAGSLSGLAFDSRSQWLWVASGVFDQTPAPETAFRGLIAVDPANGEEKRRISAPADGSPSDVVVRADGTVFASDPVSGALYMARPDALTLDTLVAPGTFRSPQGIVAFPDAPQILVSDYAYGLALVNIETGEIHRVAAAVRNLLDGFDGLWLVDGRIVGIQNGMRPMQIVELMLSADRLSVDGARYLESANPAWTEPVGGTISGLQLAYVATGQWDRFGDGGAEVEEPPALPTEIRVLNLDMTDPAPAPPPGT